MRSHLANRSIPSVLAQTYENFELLVIGDAATPEVEEAARSFDDPRVRFENLPLRGPYPADRARMWFVAGAAPANEALRVARGHWLAPQDDDDAFTPDHLQVLLDDARSRRLELSYGLIRRIAPDGSGELLGAWPPEAYNFGLQSVLFHRGLRMFQFETADALFGNPGDWAWVRRMLRVGVRIGRIDVPVVDYFPAQLWRENEDPPLVPSRRVAAQASSPRTAVRSSRIAISVVSLGGCVWWATKQEAPDFPSSADGILLILAAVAVYAIATLLRGWRWHMILRHAHIEHQLKDAVAITTIGYMGNTVLPARGGEVLRILLLGDRSNAKRREVLGSIVPERILDAAALVAAVPRRSASCSRARRPPASRPASSSAACCWSG